MEQKEQTAVEWLIEELVKTIDADNSQNAEDLRIKLQSFVISVEIKAKDMELQQLDDIYHDGWADARTAILHS